MEFLGLLADVNQCVNDYQRGVLTPAGLTSGMRNIVNRIHNTELTDEEASELLFNIELFLEEAGTYAV